jgi:hypothetical protein
MVVIPDTSQLDKMNSDPSTGGPWVMWKGTPYAHIMVPMGPKAAGGTKMGAETKPAETAKPK